jgi:ATP-dependent DNA helicase RecQ
MTKHDILKKYYGYDQFRPGQETMIDTILSGNDALGIMPTGAGKSICYQVPAMLLSGITLVISPLISLMRDQVQSLNQAGIPAAYINSSLTEQQIRLALKYAVLGKYKIIYVAPERLLTNVFLRFSNMVEISMLTVDEAHCISQWGQDFRPSYVKIVDFIETLPKRPVVSAFTATATEKVKEDIIHALKLRKPGVLVTGFDRKNLYFAVEKPKKKERFVLDYVKKHEKESGIIYCATRKNVDAVYMLLKKEGFPASRYHAGLSNEERRQNQEDFIFDRMPIMVATNAFGMGIDKSNVRYVLHFNMPQSIENYYQEAGRAGRDGEASECVLLYSAQDLMINRFLLESKEENEELTREEAAQLQERDEERLQDMNRYCLTMDCLREYLLAYFGEELHRPCGNCSNCRQELEELDMTKEAVKIIECIMEMRQRYGINVVAGTLAGSERAKLKSYHVSEFKSYGSLKEFSENKIKEMINWLIVEEILTVTKDKYALIKLTKDAFLVAQGKKSVILKKKKEDAAEKKEAVAKEKKTAAKTGKVRKSDVLNSRGMDLFECLRKLRAVIAKEEKMPPYIIFSDKSLIDMCMKLPFDKKEMLEVSGVGEYKFEKYGERFLQEILLFTNGKKEKFYFEDVNDSPFRVEEDVNDSPFRADN